MQTQQWKQEKYVACEDANFVSQANLVECAIDATGVPDVGAKVATDAMKNKKHVVMLNVETDVVIGPYLKKLAQKEGVIYTGSAGDEPGAVMELYSFAKAMGMNVEVMGKGKNNKIDYECNPDTVLEEATRRVMSPKMLCAFKDGTKTMVEMTAMSNYTGLIPDVIGGHGPKTAPGTEGVKELNDIFKLKEDGGILNKHGVVEYVNGIAPGVFVTVSTPNEEIAYQMGYHSMGPGPLWTLYRPYHLCNLETPLTVAKAVIDGEVTCTDRWISIRMYHKSEDRPESRTDDRRYRRIHNTRIYRNSRRIQCQRICAIWISNKQSCHEERCQEGTAAYI